MRLDIVQLEIGDADGRRAALHLHGGRVFVAAWVRGSATVRKWDAPAAVRGAVQSLVADVVAGGPTQPLADFLLENGAPDWVGLAVAGNRDWWRHLPNRDRSAGAEPNGGTA